MNYSEALIGDEVAESLKEDIWLNFARQRYLSLLWAFDSSGLSILPILPILPILSILPILPSILTKIGVLSYISIACSSEE